MSVGSVNIVRNGLIFYVDAENSKSYSGSGVDWYDLTSNDNNGVLENGPTFDFNGPASFVFDGVNDYVELGDVLDMGTYSYTINTWVNLNLGGYQWFLSKGVAATQYNRYGIGCWSTNNLFAFMIGNSQDILVYGSTDLPTNEWFMVTVVFDRTSDIKIYYNAALETLSNASGPNSTISQWNGLDIQSNNPMRVGSFTDGDNTSTHGVTNGRISISQIYNRALTPAEILQNYNSTKWRFYAPTTPTIVTDQLILNLDAGNSTSYPGSGTTWYDLTTNNNDGTLTNGTYYDSVDGGVMVFDGVNDFVNLGTSIGKPSQYTISTWIKPNSWNNCGIVFSSNTGGGQGSTHWGLWGRVNGNIEVYVSNGSSYQSANTSLPWSASDIPNSSFTNIVITVDGSNIRIFKNSIQIGSDIAQTISQSGTAYDLCIGKNPADSGYFYDGYVSGVLIYDKDLTPAEVLQNYNAQKSRFGL